jgi:hypothetical protein
MRTLEVSQPPTVVVLAVVLTFGTILIPLGVADAKRNYQRQRGNQAEQTQKPSEPLRKCVASSPTGNCYCNLDDQLSWQEGDACHCAYYGIKSVEGHAVPEFKFVVGTPVCPLKNPYAEPPPRKERGTDIFKQMKP